MNTKAFFAGVISFIIGFFCFIVVGEGLLPDYFFTVGIVIALAGIILLAVGGTFNLTQKDKLLINPLIGTIIWNVGLIYLFISMDQQLFGDFVRDYGLNGSWSLFTLNMHANIGGTIKTYPYINSTFTIFLMCVLGNIALSAVNMARIYKANKEPSIPPPP
jgi:hypothetical protein